METEVLVVIDRSEWSRSSQNSYGSHYDKRATNYENIAYRCKKCFAACVFTAAEQKHAYEVEKRFIWWLPSLCEKHQAELVKLKTEERACQERWNNEKAALESNAQFLQRWLFVLKEILSYGKRGNPTIITMLTKRLTNLPDTRK